MRTTVATWQALGDMIVSIPIAQHLEALGHEVALVSTYGGGQLGVQQYAETLPTYPDFSPGRWGRKVRLQPWQLMGSGDTREEDLPQLPVGYGQVIDLTTDGLNWQSKRGMIADLAKANGITFGEAPRVPILARPGWHAARETGLPYIEEPYVLVACEGSDEYRRLSQEQVAAIAKGNRVVIVHPERREYNCDALNLTGQTTLMDLYALAANALAIVSVDTGVLHLGPAFHVPTVGVVGRTINPLAVGRVYKPSVFLRTRGSVQAVPPEAITETLTKTILVRPLNPTKLPAIGIRWWETAEVQTRLRWADEYQRRIDRAFSGNVVEVPVG
jgi:hypothetical protein